MAESKSKYTEKGVFEIFKEQHRLCSPLDPMADRCAEITAEMTISEWRDANDLLEWDELCLFLNQEFRIKVPVEIWYKVLEPAYARRLKEVCQLISKHAYKDVFEPRTMFGSPCIKAGVFLTIKKNLKDKGVDVSNLQPSSSLGEYLVKYFSPVIEEITLTGTKPIDKLEVRRRKRGFWNAINIFDSDRYEILTRDVNTFRDLVKKIIQEKV